MQGDIFATDFPERFNRREGARVITPGYTPLRRWRDGLAEGAVVVTTNGFYDGWHAGHVHFLDAAREVGCELAADGAPVYLVVAVDVPANADAPHVRKPAVIFPLGERMMIVDAHEAVDIVVPLWESPPYEFILAARPTVHCKAGDWEHLPEAAVIESVGGVVRMLPRREDFEISSSTEMKRRIREAAGDG
jgi:bifunctional ADP-heptose synthase (sugar kinase/adenylyltransferase)